MSDGGPSVTDRWLAAQRARLDRTRPSTPRGDVAGERLLHRDVAGRTTPALGPAGPVELRTRVVDAEVSLALGRGIEQVVMVAGGYDGRALRFGGGPARWYEVDRPGILADRRRRLARLGVASSGWSSDVAVAQVAGPLLGQALAVAGHDPARPTLFVCEQVALVEPLEAVAGILDALRERASPGSVVVAGFEVAPDVAGVTRAVRSVRQRVSAPGRDLYRPGDPEKLFVVTGWRVTRAESARTGRLDAGAHAHVLVGEPGS